MPGPVTQVPVVVRTAPPPKQLVRTGPDVGGPALLATVLLVLGALLLVAAALQRRALPGVAESVDRETSWFRRPPTGARDSLLGGAGLGGGPPEHRPD